MTNKFRREKDEIGELNIDNDNYWGIYTERIIRNFKITYKTVNKKLIKSIALVKKACCLTNLEIKYIDKTKASAILHSCDEIIEGKLDNQFPIDYLQAQTGKSINMNINEVIANRSIEILGGEKGNYCLIHPLKDVNLHQSATDIFSTAVKITCIYELRFLREKIIILQDSLQKKEKDFRKIIKIGRIELQETVPITLGFEFAAFAEAISRDCWRISKCEERLRVVNIGGTFIGTGITAPQNYIFLVIEKLRNLTGIGLSRSENLPGETANADIFVEISGILKAHAVNLIKIANDIRILNLLKEIYISPIQTNFSMIDSQINPISMMESAIQVAIKCIGNDLIVTESASRGTLQVIEFLPLIADSLLENLHLLKKIDNIFSKIIESIKANKYICEMYCKKSPMILTAFIPFIGYEKVFSLIQEFQRNISINYNEFNIKKFLKLKLDTELVESILSLPNLTSLGFKTKK